MALTWHLAGSWRGTDAERLFSSLDRAFSVCGDRVASSSLSEVLAVRAHDTLFYVKRYFRSGKRFRRFLGRSRVQGEWQNLQFLGDLGIPCASVVAFGLERRFGLFQRGALVTAEVPDAVDLETISHEGGGPFTDRRWRDAVSAQVAEHVCRMHGSRFIHSDFKWRNILVTRGARPRVTLIDCPTGGIFPLPDFHYRRAKELGRLDLAARRHLTRTERLRFFKRYCGSDRLTPSQRRLLRRVATHHD